MDPSRRWLYHIFVADVGDVVDGAAYAPAGFVDEGFIHASFQPAVAESARLYFPAGAALRVLQVHPERVRFEIVETPRGPMPHILEPIAATAIARVLTVDQIAHAPDDFVRPPI